MTQPLAGPRLAHALWYAARGVPVFPLKPGTKLPATRHGVKDASTEPHAVAALFMDGRRPFNIGLACGHLFDVIDVDTTDWSIIEQAAGGLPQEAWLGVARTPRGGCHIYIPPAPGASNKVGMLPGIDYRALGGYVVAPPSALHNPDATVGRWEWVDPPQWGVAA